MIDLKRRMVYRCENWIAYHFGLDGFSKAETTPGVS